MIFLAFFGMTAKFVSASLAQVYREIDDEGQVHGGPMYYLRLGLGAKGWPRLGALFGGLYADFSVTFNTPEELVVTAVAGPDLGSDTVIHYYDHTLTLMNVDMDDLSSDDFRPPPPVSQRRAGP